jgi:hypothetical protein
MPQVSFEAQAPGARMTSCDDESKNDQVFPGTIVGLRPFDAFELFAL